MKGKKGASIILMLFEVIAVVLIVAILLQIATGFANSESVQTINLAQEFSLMVESLVIVSGNAVVQYPYNLSSYIIALDNQGVSVKKEGDSKLNLAYSKFHLPVNYAAAGSVMQAEKVCLKKEFNVIIIEECFK